MCDVLSVFREMQAAERTYSLFRLTLHEATPHAW